MGEEAKHVPATTSKKADEVPDDFPRPVIIGALSGAQPKVLQVENDGKFYPAGAGPNELKERFEICQDLVKQLAKKSLESKGGKRSHLTETEILLQYQTRLIATNWTSVEEAYWIINSVAAEIGWKLVRL